MDQELITMEGNSGIYIPCDPTCVGWKGHMCFKSHISHYRFWYTITNGHVYYTYTHIMHTSYTGIYISFSGFVVTFNNFAFFSVVIHQKRNIWQFSLPHWLCMSVGCPKSWRDQRYACFCLAAVPWFIEQKRQRHYFTR